MSRELESRDEVYKPISSAIPFNVSGVYLALRDWPFLCEGTFPKLGTYLGDNRVKTLAGEQIDVVNVLGDVIPGDLAIVAYDLSNEVVT